ncbi:MAG: peptidyl-alpha-hydroxyglycine alpha-amidating lyase family protein [Bryobacteraceae bacterium]
MLVVLLTVLAQSYVHDPAWPQLPAGWILGETAAAAADAKGHVYIFHRGPHPIIEFDRAGKMVRSWGDGSFPRPHGIRVDPEGNLWAIDAGAHVVVKMNSQGRVVLVLGRAGESGLGPDRFNGPTDVAVTPAGDFYVSDGYGNSRVAHFSRDGALVRSWGSKGSGRGTFALPHGIALDRAGRVYVADRENKLIQIFDKDGKFLQQWDQAGAASGLVFVDPHLFVASGNRVYKMTLDGKVLGVIGDPGKPPGKIAGLHHLAVGPGGDIYTAELSGWRAQRFRPAGP